jgi:hypothetical protein
MPRISSYAAAAAWLALSAASAPACQLSVLGPVIQQPLTYNPFQAGAATAEVSFTVRNGDGKPCDAAFAFFRPGALQARAEGGAALNYQVLSASGPAALEATSPPTTLPGGSAVAHVTVGAKQTYTAHAAISVGDGQVAGPGTYRDQLTLGVYQKEAGGPYKKAAEAPLGVTIAVNSQMTLAVAGGGRKTTLNFGEFVDGATRSVRLLAYSNQGFNLVVRSDNAGIMKHNEPSASTDRRGSVPYTIAFDGALPVDLSQQRTISHGRGATKKAGLIIPIDVQVGSIKSQPAGFYRDVITIAIDPGF